MANIKEVRDSGPNPNSPTLEQMRQSQLLGSVGKGTQSQDYGEMEADFNIGTGKDVGPDKTSFPRWSNDEDVAEFPATDKE